MNWNAISAIGEIVGAGAVVCTLAYLAVQIRQNTLSNRAALSWSLNQALADLNGKISGSADLAEIWVRGCKDLQSLSPVERERFATYVFDRLNLAVYAEFAINRQSLSDVHIDYVDWLIVFIEGAPGIQDFVASLPGGVRFPASLREKFERRNPEMARRMKLVGSRGAA